MRSKLSEGAGDNGFIPALGGLRGVAALSVVLSHLALHHYLPEFPAYGAGAIGVMLFFALSGFLMTHLYLPQRAVPSAVFAFARARFARIYPLYALVILVSGLLSMIGVAVLYKLHPDQVLTHLLLIEGDRVFWTISVEFQFYGLFAVLWLGTRGVTNASDRTIALLLLVLYVALWWTGAPGERISIVRNGQVFIVGMLAALVVRNLPGRQWTARLVLPFAFVLMPALWGVSLLLWDKDPEPVYRSVGLQAVLGLLLWSAVSAKHSAITQLLSSRPLLALGEWSFGIYLLHIPIIRIGNGFSKLLGIDRAWLVVPILICVIALARTSYTLIETPFRRMLTSRRQSAVA